MIDIDCGGCKGLGSHARRCPQRPGYNRWDIIADEAVALGDRIGSNDPGAANHCYYAANRLREKAQRQREGTGT